MKTSLIVSSALAAFASGSVLHLTNEDFDQVVLKGTKPSLVKFFAPWCGHCKEMRPAWDALGEEYGGDSVNIVDVDCTAEDELCSKHEVQGFPTVMYFDTDEGALKSYSGGRDKSSLKDFVIKHLLPKCTVEGQEKCSEKEKKYIEKYKPLGYDAVEKEYERLNKMKNNSMKSDKKGWLLTRLRLLKSMRDPALLAAEAVAVDDDMDDDTNAPDL